MKTVLPTALLFTLLIISSINCSSGNQSTTPSRVSKQPTTTNQKSNAVSNQKSIVGSKQNSVVKGKISLDEAKQWWEKKLKQCEEDIKTAYASSNTEGEAAMARFNETNRQYNKWLSLDRDEQIDSAMATIAADPETIARKKAERETKEAEDRRQELALEEAEKARLREQAWAERLKREAEKREQPPPYVFSKAPSGRRSQIRVFIEKPPLSEQDYLNIASVVAERTKFRWSLVRFFDWEPALTGWDGTGSAGGTPLNHWLCQVVVDLEGSTYKAHHLFIPDEEITGIPREKVIKD